MKRYLVILLSLVFVLGTVSFAVADDGGMDSVRAMQPGAKVMLGGDMRVRGTWKKNNDFDKDTINPKNDNAYYDQRFRLKIKGEAGNGVSANVRLYMANSVKWDGAANSCTGCIKIDYAYVTVPVSTFTVNAGLMKTYYGNAFMNNENIPGQMGDQFDERRETIEVIGTFETVTIKAFTSKIADTFDSVTGDENLKDFNDYGVMLVADLGEIEAGGIVIYHHDNRETIPGTGNDDGTDISIYAKGAMQNIKVGAEVVFLTGDINKDSADNTPLGFMAYAETTVGAIGVRADAAFSMNGYQASYSYEPTLLIGTTQQTALTDFTSFDDENAFLIAASANTDVMENVNALARVAYWNAKPTGGGDSLGLLELDGEILVQIAKNARYFIEAAWGNPNDELGEDSAFVLANRVELFF
ncbi:MAG: hypothetical protein JSW20_06410 [Nitrospiraceae bacterium]|nr:MAG: hypothetical protein JSW20_06410 [Nitrospiraceae bacterium]